MWVTKLLIFPVEIRIFAPKQPNLAENWHFWSIWARLCRLIQCPVVGSVGGCGARAVSRKTPIYFISLIFIIIFVITHQHHRRHPHGMVGRVIPWPASDPSLDSVELCHENQHCAPFAGSLYHHHQDFQFKGVLDVYSR